jgi:hypothetical protein
MRLELQVLILLEPIEGLALEIIAEDVSLDILVVHAATTCHLEVRA